MALAVLAMAAGDGPATFSVSSVRVGHNPVGVTVSPDGRLAYVPNSGPDWGSDSSLGSVSVIDTATNRTTGKPIPVGNTPSAVVVSRDGRV
ncbi:hypothetical protein OG548_35455 [Streptomyces sp. NBC_01356]|uniref:YncE family protein n=1 Tax=Streptomyces sp. NBC_01356 TaxID=2903836 RepID=UPI002E30B036|nr:hypothetical protein [Streptomyces sp. NBC_01356]